MKKSSPRLRTFLASAATGAAMHCGCETTQTVKDFNADREKYITTHFSAAKLPASVRGAIEKGVHAESKAHKITATFETTLTSDTQAYRYEGTLTFYPQPHGLVLRQEEFSNNNFAYLVNNAISLFGILDLDEQPVFLKMKNIGHTRSDVYVQRIISMNPSSFIPAENTSFSLAVEWRTRDVIVGTTLRGGGMTTIWNQGLTGPIRGPEMTALWSVGKSGILTLKYTFGSRYPASKVHPGFKGDAIDVSCEELNEAGTVMSRSTFFYLMDYGLAIPEESSSSTAKSEVVLKTVKVE